VVQGLEEMRKGKLNMDIFHCTEELKGYCTLSEHNKQYKCIISGKVMDMYWQNLVLLVTSKDTHI
jgi:hypothetical protein